MLYGSTVMSTAFCDLVFELNFSQVILQPTHSHGNFPDLVLTNNDELVSPPVIQSQPPLPVNTDHFITSFDTVWRKILMVENFDESRLVKF